MKKLFNGFLISMMALAGLSSPAWAIRSIPKPSGGFFQEFIAWGFLIMLFIPPCVPFIIIFFVNLFLEPRNKKSLIASLITNIVLFSLVFLILFLQEKYPISFFVAILFFLLNIILVAFKMYKRKLIKGNNKNAL